MRFKIAEKTYSIDDIEKLSLQHILKLEMETADFGRKITLDDYKAMGEAFGNLKTDAERETFPDRYWVMGVTIWAARKLAGESTTFDEAISFPMTDFVPIPEPQDHKTAANPTKAPRKGSAAPAKRAGNARTSARTT